LRVLIAEDHALLRDGLIRLLEAHDFEVVEAVDNGPRLVPALVEHRPDVAVVDVRLPPTFTDEGLQAAIAARTEIPGLPVLVLSQHVDDLLMLTVSDDGVGGADPARGTGLRGIARRLAAFDGTMTVSSPPGGPTVVTMELPCVLSSPKTSPSSGTG